MLQYVGFWLRFWATVIDSMLICLITIPLAYFWLDDDTPAFGVTLSGPVSIVVSYILPAAVVIAFWSSRHATPGKLVFGAKIVDARTGAPPSFKQHVVRYLGYFISTFFFFLGFLWVAVDPRKQGWHDKLAGTVVVRPLHSATKAVHFDLPAD
ncbi:MAG: RDD family protein [Burkholderiaceae bacterium]